LIAIFELPVTREPGLRWNFRSQIVVAALLVGLTEAAPAAETAQCGASVKEAIAAAEAALSQKGSEGERRALVCLTAAIKKLEAERLDVVRGKDKAHLLSVPRGP
jgi:hypothetical protein